MVRDAFGVQLTNRDDEIKITGERDQVSKAAAVLEQMQKKLRRQDWLSLEDVGQAIGRAADEHPERSDDEIEVFARNHSIRPKTEGQKRYIDSILKNDLTFCIGP